MAALPATAIALPTTDLEPNIPSFCALSMFYRPNCPRHSTYKNWQDIAKLYCKLTGVAKAVKQHNILAPVMQWLNATFEQHKKRSLASNCTCDDEADGSDSRILFGEDGSEYIIFCLPSRGI